MSSDAHKLIRNILVKTKIVKIFNMFNCQSHLANMISNIVSQNIQLENLEGEFLVAAFKMKAFSVPSSPQPLLHLTGDYKEFET